jgi:putative DNA primase/helicase
MNSLPAVADSSHGFWRRVRLIPFNRVFTEKEMIIGLKDRLVEELPGIFNWVMRGLHRLQERGNFEIPAQVKSRTEKYKKESNPVSLFVEDECYQETNLARVSTVSTTYSTYKSWCLDNGYKPLSSRRFKDEMQRLKHPTQRTNRGVVYLNIGLKSVP